jgi:hypothetical protein
MKATQNFERETPLVEEEEDKEGERRVAPLIMAV